MRLGRRGLLATLLAGPAGLVGAARAQADERPSGIPRGYADVDPRTAARVPLWQELGAANPIFPGDPEFSFDVVATVPVDGFQVEQITSLGSHQSTHLDAPGHFIEGRRLLADLGEGWTLMPLAMLDVRARVAAEGEFSVTVADLKAWERRYGRIPRGGLVVLFTGFSANFDTDPEGTPGGSYFDPAPGFTAQAVAWLFEERGIRGVGSDTFGPDATSDADFSATYTTLAKGGVAVPNLGPGLARMRQHGDWVSLNGPRLAFSGFPIGVTGFTARRS